MRIVVLGSGPTGLGAGWRLNQSGHDDWRLFDRMDRIGGLSTSYVDEAGFTWDVGGHVLFSHFELFDGVVEKALGGDYYSHERECWVRILDTWVPYPFQNNIRYLPPKARDACVEGLRSLKGSPGSAANFREWMDAVFGEGIVNCFMAPYNFKVWATPPELMSKDWIAERVSVVDLERIERNIRDEIDDVAWGPNNLFKFPRKGGTGAIYQGIAAEFLDRIHLNQEVVGVDFGKKRLRFANGEIVGYEKLISTLPVDQLVAMSSDAPEEVRQACRNLLHNSVHVVGIGVEGRREDSRCWMYFPEDNCPFYRVTNFHNYSPFNVPEGKADHYFSLMCEISTSEHKPVDANAVVEETIQGLINCGLLSESERSKIVSRFHLFVPYAYPIPSVHRDRALNIIQPFLESRDVYSRGRFGAWKYEIGNMDHSFMQGVEVVDRLLNQGDEPTFKS